MVRVNGVNIVKSVFPNKEIQFLDFYSVQDKVCRGDGVRLTINERAIPELFMVDGTIYIDFIYESNADITNLLLYKSYLDNTSPKAKKELTMKFCPYGQSDRDFPDSLGTMKYFAKLINAANFDKVTIYDPHSPVITACLDRCEDLYPILSFDWEKYDLVCYPDAGACKKYSEILETTKYIYGYKKRNLDTGAIIKYEVLAEKEEVAGKSVLLIDDLVIRGGTYKYAAQALREMGAASIDLYITHVMPSARDFWTNSHKMYGIDNVYSANTLEIPWVDSKEPVAAAEVDESANN